MTQGPLAAEYVAKAMAAGSAGIAGLTWITALNDVLQLVATAVAIIAGIYAIIWHRVRIDDVRSKVEQIHDQVTAQLKSNMKTQVEDIHEEMQNERDKSDREGS